jgi:hypothetical protein
MKLKEKSFIIAVSR